MNDKISPSVTDQWFQINKEVRFFKILSMVLALTLIIESILLSLQYFTNPIFVLSGDEDRHYYVGRRPKNFPDKEDAKALVTQFIKLRFTFIDSHFKESLRDLSPFVSSSYLHLLKTQLEKDLGRDSDGFSQTIANIQVSVGDKEVKATFDKIIRIKGIPLLVPTEAIFEIVRDRASQLNPMGILVNGVIEHANK